MMSSIGTKGLPLAILAGFLFSTAASGVAVDRDPTIEPLRDIQLQVVQISEHAATIRTMLMKPGTYDLQSHKYELGQVKSRINEIGELVPKLQGKTEIPKWQMKIIDDISGLLAAMSAQKEAAIKQVNRVSSSLELYSNVYEARSAIPRMDGRPTRVVRYRLPYRVEKSANASIKDTSVCRWNRVGGKTITTSGPTLVRLTAVTRLAFFATAIRCLPYCAIRCNRLAS